jgi:hypothetical protein
MKFRKNLFTVLAFLSLAFMAYGFLATGAAVDEVTSTAVPTVEGSDAETTTAFRDAGVAVGAGVSITIFLCIGFPFFVVFSLLAWRNSAGLKAERRHQELLAAQRGK